MNKKFTLATAPFFFLFFLFFAYSGSAQPVCSGDITLASQAEVDAFSCSEIAGNLTISGDDITNLDALAGLQKVGGHFNIEVNINLENLDGLSNLTWVEGTLYLRYDTILENLNGLSALKHVGALYILDNHRLTNLDGLSSLTEVDGFMYVAYNSRLVEVDGFSSLQSVNGELRIYNNPHVTRIGGFDNLHTAGGVSVVANPSLSTIEGFHSVVNIEDTVGNKGSLLIEGNDVLTDVNGFTALQSARYFEIGNNPSLSDLQSFLSLQSLFAIYIRDNAALTDINVFASIDSIEGELRIQNNDQLLDLSAFSSLKKVGSISIYENDNLTSIDGLTNVTEIGWGLGTSLWISNNGALAHLDGFSALTKIGGPVAIKYNRSLQSIDGFSSVTQLNGHVEISNNDVLTTIGGFRTLTKLSHSSFGIGVIINQNPMLLQVNGFSSLKEIEGTQRVIVEIGDNPLLTNFDGLSNLTTITAGGRGVGVSIYHNPSLKNLRGFSSLASIHVGYGGSLYIHDNDSLENIDGLASLQGDIYGPFLYLTITDNAMLSKCDGIRPYFVSLGSEAVLHRVNLDVINIADNGAGCTVEDILATGPIVIAHFVVIDQRTGDVVTSFFNNSVSLDIANPGFPYWAIRAQTIPEEVGSVTFTINGTSSGTDNTSPYVMPVQLREVGAYTLNAEIFSEADGGGTKGIGKSATINLFNSAAVISFDVVDTSGKVLMQLSQGSKINIKDPAFKSFSIRANVNPEVVGSVKFWLNNQFFRVENVAPYAFNGDNNGVYNPWNVNPWDYTIRAVPYIKVDGKEYAGEPLQVTFKVVSENILSVFSFELVDGNGRILRELKDGDMIDVNEPLFNEMTVIANVIGEPGSVTFHVNNQFYHIENVWPYTLTGNNNDDFTPWVPEVGNYLLTATPYTSAGGTGNAGNSLTIQVQVVNGAASSLRTDFGADKAASLGVTISPVPVDDLLLVTVADEWSGEAYVTILNSHGRMVYEGNYSGDESITTSKFQPGVYFLRVVSHGRQVVTKFIKK